MQRCAITSACSTCVETNWRRPAACSTQKATGSADFARCWSIRRALVGPFVRVALPPAAAALGALRSRVRRRCFSAGRAASGARVPSQPARSVMRPSHPPAVRLHRACARTPRLCRRGAALVAGRSPEIGAQELLSHMLKCPGAGIGQGGPGPASVAKALHVPPRSSRRARVAFHSPPRRVDVQRRARVRQFAQPACQHEAQWQHYQLLQALHRAQEPARCVRRAARSRLVISVSEHARSERPQSCPPRTLLLMAAPFQTPATAHAGRPQARPRRSALRRPRPFAVTSHRPHLHPIRDQRTECLHCRLWPERRRPAMSRPARIPAVQSWALRSTRHSHHSLHSLPNLRPRASA